MGYVMALLWVPGPLFIHSDSILLILFKSILSNNSLCLSVFLFSAVASFLPVSCPVYFGANRAGIMLAAAISPTAVHFGRVICFALWFLRQISILPLTCFNTPYDLAVAICSKYPVTGSTTTFKHFECIIKFVLPFTTVVLNGGITASLIVQILPFTPSRLYSETSRPFTIFLLETTVLRCTHFQVSPACFNSVLVSHQWMVYELGGYLHLDSILHTYSKQPKNSTSSLYQGKSCIVMLASTYPSYGIKIPSVPLRCNTYPTNFLSGRIFNPISVQNPSVRAEIWDPVSTSAIVSTPYTTTLASCMTQ